MTLVLPLLLMRYIAFSLCPCCTFSDTPIAAILGKEYEQNGKAKITVLNCLLHNAGYPPDPSPNYCALLPSAAPRVGALLIARA